ncbi:MAG: type II toxin-antitoxin system VapC family toxin [Deferrisomatales bacterium]
MRDEGRVLWISRQVIREYLAVLSRPQTFSKPVPTSALSSDVRRFEQAFRVADEESRVTRALLDLVERVPAAGRQIHDANIVATMVAKGIGRVLTNNVGDFERFSPWKR